MIKHLLRLRAHSKDGFPVIFFYRNVVLIAQKEKIFTDRNLFQERFYQHHCRCSSFSRKKELTLKADLLHLLKPATDKHLERIITKRFSCLKMVVLLLFVSFFLLFWSAIHKEAPAKR